MKAVSEKIYLSLKMPVEDGPLSDQSRIRMALNALGYENIAFSLPALRQLYPMCRKAGFDITVTLVHREWDDIVMAAEPGDTRQNHYGLAVDYGSTTIIMQLVDMNSGAVIGEEKCVNGQTAFGADILTRITWAMEEDIHKEVLQQATVDTFHTLLDRLTEETGIQARNCPVMILSGNTAMIHFLLKLEAWTVFASPYAPVTTEPGFLWGQELGMDFPGLVYLIPSASNYIGGDIVSGLLEAGIHKKEEISLFFDIGTNGELVVGNRHWVMAGAGAAGPALEGYISRFGMRAAPGAIDHVRILEGELTYTTIGNEKPLGICGSGIIDLLAQLRLHGWMDISGTLEAGASPRIRETDGELAVVYAYPGESGTGEALYFSQTDIRQYLDTKAAAYTMVECLLEAAGTGEEDLGQVILSGAFPAHSDLESAIAIGLFPDLDRTKYRTIANTSLAGARALLLDGGLMKEARELAENMYCIQFASIPDFLVRMQAAKFVPHTDMGRYPTVKEKIEDIKSHKF